MMTNDEIKAIIHEVLSEQSQDEDKVVIKTISAILSSFGIDDEDRKEIKADFTHLRKWRKSVEQARELYVQGGDHRHSNRPRRRPMDGHQGSAGQMTFPLWFVYWVLAFLLVVAGLSIAAAFQEWRIWRRENR
jgi:hypothetical protein